jgi:hypothetical protein
MPSARNGSLLPPIKGAAAADSGAGKPARLLLAFLPARESGSLSPSGGNATGVAVLCSTRTAAIYAKHGILGPCH